MEARTVYEFRVEPTGNDLMDRYLGEIVKIAESAVAGNASAVALLQRKWPGLAAQLNLSRTEGRGADQGVNGRPTL